VKIKKNDNVLVIAGKDEGKTGKVRFAFPEKNKAIVEGISFQKKHSKAKSQVKQAGIIEREGAVNISNLMLICKACNKPARVGYKTLEDGRKVRVCRACQEVID
jgi:large subunit ribosomal protein L24